MKFVKQFIEACGEERLQDCEGDIVRVTHTFDSVIKIESLDFNEGEEFNIKEALEEIKERYEDKTWGDIRDGRY